MMISPTAISPHNRRGGINWSSYWTKRSPEMMAVYNQMTTKPSQTVAEAMGEFCKSLVDGGVWAKLDRLFVFAAHTNDNGEALIDWIHPTGTPAVLANGAGGSVPTFTIGEGFRGSNANKSYINTQFNPSTQGVNYTLNSASLGAYVLSFGTAGTFMVAGSQNGRLYLSPRYDNGAFRGSLNSGDVYSFNTKASGPGLFSLIKPDANTIRRYQNTTAYADVAINSTQIPNRTISFLNTYNEAYYCNDQVSFGYLGGALTTDDITVMKNAIDAFFLVI